MAPQQAHAAVGTTSSTLVMRGVQSRALRTGVKAAAGSTVAARSFLPLAVKALQQAYLDRKHATPGIVAQQGGASTGVPRGDVEVTNHVKLARVERYMARRAQPATAVTVPRQGGASTHAATPSATPHLSTPGGAARLPRRPLSVKVVAKQGGATHGVHRDAATVTSTTALGAAMTQHPAVPRTSVSAPAPGGARMRHISTAPVVATPQQGGAALGQRCAAGPSSSAAFGGPTQHCAPRVHTPLSGVGGAGMRRTTQQPVSSTPQQGGAALGGERVQGPVATTRRQGGAALRARQS